MYTQIRSKFSPFQEIMQLFDLNQLFLVTIIMQTRCLTKWLKEVGKKYLSCEQKLYACGAEAEQEPP